MKKKFKIHSFARGIFAGGLILFIFNLPLLFQMTLSIGMIASLILMVMGGFIIYKEYQKNPSAFTDIQNKDKK